MAGAYEKSEDLFLLMTIINDCFVEEQRDTLAIFFEHGLLGLNGYIDDNLLQDCFA